MRSKLNRIKNVFKNLESFLKSKNLTYQDSIDTSLGSQKGQVEFLINNFFDYENNGLKKNGIFVDLACADGITYNNTYFLEQYLNWSGLLIEPNPKFKESIKKYRTSNFIDYCISNQNDKEVDFRIDNLLLGGFVGEEFDNNYKTRKEELKNAEIIRLKTKTLETVFNEFNMPDTIDYLSLDVEGAEESILLNFNFDKYKFKFLTIERPTTKLDIVLESNGYIQLLHAWFDVFYCHRDYLENINFKPKKVFKLTPQKDY